MQQKDNSCTCWLWNAERMACCVHTRGLRKHFRVVYTEQLIESKMGLFIERKEIFLEHVCLGCLDVPHLCHQIRDRLNRTFAHKHSRRP